ncbi:RNA polymerase sigma factor SigX [Pontibacillus marinus]|uniref:RNA polymerase sigma factor n=1 Tax=Pontibacillus marinus BH030004 = DSM 16465 TaxID=1385511 RepID=A0A0A5HIZ0_9BACI|nr:RNA polymerase sigma factor SigX [Pontibacillus marinus]KGX83602.1 RNA polymerase sigma factor SigX [Pontibacillus marinus BH030004 = DSM 16465]
MKSVFQELYENYHKDVFQFLFYMVKNREQAEDLVQEVYIKVMNSYDRFKGDSSEKTWLFSIARHVAIDHFRKQKRKRNRVLEFFDWGEKGHLIQDDQPEPEEVALQNEEIQKIYRCLDHCSVDQKSVIILRYIQSMSIQETADILGMSVSKVKTTQHRGMKTLQKLMQEDQKEGINSEAK